MHLKSIKGFVNALGILTEEHTNKQYDLSNSTCPYGHEEHGFFMIRKDVHWEGRWYCVRKILTNYIKTH